MKKTNMNHYLFFETNKEVIIATYNLPRYNPTDMLNEYNKFLRQKKIRTRYTDNHLPFVEEFLFNVDPDKVKY